MQGTRIFSLSDRTTVFHYVDDTIFFPSLEEFGFQTLEMFVHFFPSNYRSEDLSTKEFSDCSGDGFGGGS